MDSLTPRRLLLHTLWLTVLLVLPGRTQSTARAQEAPKLPEPLRGAKVYRIPEESKPGTVYENPVIYNALSYQDINLERLVLNLSLSVKPADRAATIRRIYFQDIRVNGVPVHVETYETEFKLSKKEIVALPAPLKCSIVFSDFESLAPVQEIVNQDKLRITGQSFIEVKLNALEKIAVRAKRLVLPITVSEEVPLEMFSGNPVLKLAAGKILDTLSDPSTSAAMALAKEHISRLTADRSLETKVRESIYLLVCEYEVRDPNTGTTEKFSQAGTGFVAGPEGKLVTAKRVVEPWKFDPQIAALVKLNHLEVDTRGVRLAAWPAAAVVLGGNGQLDFQSAFTTQKQTLRIVKVMPDRMETQDFQDADSGEKTTVSVHVSGEQDMAVLQLVGSAAPPLAFSDSMGTVTKTTLVGFPFGLSQTRAEPKLSWVKATSQQNMMSIDRQLNPGESGAPLVTPEGKLVGMCSGTRECITAELLRKQIP
ncbi:MAG: serine protease [Terriglobia bacterium]